MSAFHFNLVEVEVKHGDCVPENKLGGNSTAWTKSYFVSSVQDFGEFSDFLEEDNQVAYSINRAKVKEYRKEFLNLFGGQLGAYPGKGLNFNSNCDYLTTQNADPIVELNVRVNDDRVFMKFADGRDSNVHAFRELLYDGLSKIILIENNGAHEMYPAVVADSLNAKPEIGSGACDKGIVEVSLELFCAQRVATWLEQGRAVNERQRSFFHDEMTPTKILALGETGLKDFFCKSDGAGASKFQSMWSGGLNGGWSAIRPNGDTNKLDDAKKYIEKIRADASVAATYWADGPSKRPTGFGPSVVTELLMKFHPEQCIKHGSVSREALEFLKLIDIPTAYKSDYPEEEYTLVRGAATVILGKMRAMKLPRMITLDTTVNPPCAKPDSAPPDYLTVNEFLWWVKENKPEISKECEVKKMKAADYSNSTNPPHAKKPKVDVANAEDVVLLRLAAALRAKPFAILAGHSGTGKSRMVRQLAYMTAAAHNHKVLFEDANGNRLKTPGNFCMVQVKPNWHDSSDLLGYYSELSQGFKGTEFVKFICKAYAYPDVPFFVCLDEMNLAPVEQYFAEYLSAIESRKLCDVKILDENKAEKTVKSVITDCLLANDAWKKNGTQDLSGLGCELDQSAFWLENNGLTIPRNLFVVGTVNMDESTNQFSRKVLDRAFTLEMTDANFKDFGMKDPEPTFDDFAGDDFADALLNGEVIAKKPEASAPQDDRDRFDKQIKNLEALKPILADTSFVVAYRFANEYMLYENSLKAMDGVIDVTVPQPSTPATPSTTGGSTPATGSETTAEATEPKAKPEAFDDMILMKVLPRITGDEEMVMRIFVGETPAGKDPVKITDADVHGLAELLKKKGASFEKMREIIKRGESNGSGTLTFWP